MSLYPTVFKTEELFSILIYCSCSHFCFPLILLTCSTVIAAESAEFKEHIDWTTIEY